MQLQMIHPVLPIPTQYHRRPGLHFGMALTRTEQVANFINRQYVLSPPGLTAMGYQEEPQYNAFAPLHRFLDEVQNVHPEFLLPPPKWLQRLRTGTRCVKAAFSRRVPLPEQDVDDRNFFGRGKGVPYAQEIGLKLKVYSSPGFMAQLGAAHANTMLYQAQSLLKRLRHKDTLLIFPQTFVTKPLEMLITALRDFLISKRIRA